MNGTIAETTRRRFLQVAGVGVGVSVSGCLSNGSSTSLDKGVELLEGADFFSSPSCSCCDDYVDILEEEGVDVTVHKQESFKEVAEEVGIPRSMYSCHTIVTEEYVLEGHLPMEAINKLAIERPDVVAIVLPGMPSGSPGMGGVKDEEFVVYSVDVDGSTEEFVRV